jgi:cytochrome c biogenesis protein CcmG, thiol:disulfide interchange protein DsbE
MSDDRLMTDTDGSGGPDGVRGTSEGAANGADAIAAHTDDLVEEMQVHRVLPVRRRTALLVSLAMVVLVGGIVAVLGTRDPATDRQASSPLVGRVAPALTGETFDGDTFDIDDHQGRWVVVNYFATWCVPCRVEHPELVAFDQAHGGSADAASAAPRDAVLVSVLYDDDTNTAAEFFAEHGGDWPVVIDRNARIATDWGVAGVPETYLVHPNGRVAVKLIGGVTQDGLERVMAEVEAGSAAAAADRAGDGEP